jgi:PKD repeat protein
MTVASTNTATARPSPSICTSTTSAITKAPNTTTITAEPSPDTTLGRQLIANWESTSRTQTTGQAVAFTNTSIGEFSIVEWDFGDGSNSSEYEPEKVFETAGRYTVTVTVSGNSETSSFSRVLTVAAAAAAVTTSRPAPPPPSTIPALVAGSVSGVVTLQTGNCMPTIVDATVADGPPTDTCTSGPASLAVQVFAAIPATESVKGQTPLLSFTSAPDGTYSISLAPGIYSFVPQSPDPSFAGCTITDGATHCPVSVTEGTTTQHDIEVINAVF